MWPHSRERKHLHRFRETPYKEKEKKRKENSINQLFYKSERRKKNKTKINIVTIYSEN